MKKEFIIVAVLGVIIVVLLILLILPSKKQNVIIEGLVVDSPKADELISSPLEISGSTNGKGWNGFEGQVGTVRLLDSNGNQLGRTAILTATTEWTNPPVKFQTSISFVSDSEQSGTLVFHNENASGLPENDKEFVLKVKIPKVESTQIAVYFGKQGSNDCNVVYPSWRMVQKTSAPARAALEELLIGPTSGPNSETTMGLITSINSGVKIQSLKIENDTAYVDFDEMLQFQVGGSCRVSAIRAQIEKTLKQFLTVKNVVISINGRTEDILQP